MRAQNIGWPITGQPMNMETADSLLNGQVTATAGSGSVSLSAGTLPANSSCTIAITRAREILVCYLAVGPIYDSIRGDRRYRDLLQRIGLLGRDETASTDLGAERAA
jgi:hypothetical protein